MSDEMRPASGRQHPLVSVVIPTYNCEPYVAQTIGSVLAQVHRPLEVIVVDDGSTDRTAAIAEAFGDPVRVIRQPNRRVSAARNRGFEASSGEFVCFMDHDDHWFPWKLDRQVEAFAAHPDVGVVATNFMLWRQVEGRFPDPSTFDAGDEGDSSHDPEFSGWVYHQFLLDCWALTSTVMMRRTVFADSGGFDEALPFSEDWDLWLRLSREHRFMLLRRASTLYRQHAAQGNLVLRDVDYRTRLLEAAAQRWGLASRDGRHVPADVFQRHIAWCHMQFGLHHLKHGSTRMARAAFLRAWRHHPAHWKYPALLLASIAGWRPRLSA